MTDLFVGPDLATVSEVAAIDGALSAIGIDPTVVVESERLVRGGVHRRNERRHGVLPALHALQRAAGWISPGGINHLADRLGLPPAELYGVATFYDLFVTDAERAHTGDVVHVCVDAACQIGGAAEILAGLSASGVRAEASPCLGQCERAPARFVQVLGGPDRVPAAVGPPPVPQPASERRLLARVGEVNPTSLDEYVADGGFAALAEAHRLGAPRVIDEVTESGLSGRGGAAFPTGVKWRAVAAELGPRHVVVNADESEPGTFKDRVLLEGDPFSVVEAAAIAAFAVGAATVWIYVRGEYPLASERITNAVEAAAEAGLLEGVTMHVRSGAGAYICGEETALFNSIEGFRGEPRQKPPFPTTHGLFGRPTAVNNPETLVNVLPIVLGGGAAFGAVGSGQSTGTKLFCLSGHIARPGVYEVPFGTTLGQVLDLAGGVTGELAAVLLGGAAGSFAATEHLDLPLTLEATRAAGLALGSGVVMPFATGTDLRAVVTRIAEFFRHESCGQCVPCRIGTARQHELLARPGPPDGALLAELDQVMKDASICGLGHTAATAVRSALARGLA